VVNLHEGDRVLIHAAAGGVGTALVQYAKYKGCEIFGTAGSDAKLKLLREAGVDHPINYVTEDFEPAVMKITGGQGLDAIYDANGGLSVKKGFRSLASGGRLVCYGGSHIAGQNIFGKIKTLWDFGFYHPLQFMTRSKSIIGVNMLRIADNKPLVLKRCLENVVRLHEQGVFKPAVGGIFPVNQVGEAHEFLASRKSTGKISVSW
jgi:NADPH2:quinone reductase